VKPSGPPISPTAHPARAATLRRIRGDHPALQSAASERWLELARSGSREFTLDGLIKDPEWRELVPLVERVGRDAATDLPRLASYARLVLEWNRSVSNLISRSDETRLVSRHIRESIEPAQFLGESGADRWIDFGSGAGLPALPLAMVGIGARWTLVESRRPKVLFLRKAIQEMGLTNIEVEHARLEEVIARIRVEEGYGPDDVDAARKWNGFTSRATLRLGPTLEIAANAVMANGRAFLWKGSRREEEMADSSSWSADWEFHGETNIGDGSVAVCKFLRK